MNGHNSFLAFSKLPCISSTPALSADPGSRYHTRASMSRNGRILTWYTSSPRAVIPTPGLRLLKDRIFSSPFEPDNSSVTATAGLTGCPLKSVCPRRTRGACPRLPKIALLPFGLLARANLKLGFCEFLQRHDPPPPPPPPTSTSLHTPPNPPFLLFIFIPFLSPAALKCQWER